MKNEKFSGKPSERKGEEVGSDANSGKAAVVMEECNEKDTTELEDGKIIRCKKIGPGEEPMTGHEEIITGKESTRNSNKPNAGYSTAEKMDDVVDEGDGKSRVEEYGEDCRFEDAPE